MIKYNTDCHTFLERRTPLDATIINIKFKLINKVVIIKILIIFYFLFQKLELNALLKYIYYLL
jgi:hypothetical protein